MIARPYPDIQSFPVWFLNLPGPGERPPGAAVAMTVDGYVSASTPGTLTLGAPREGSVVATIDDRAIDDASNAIPIAAGVHRVRLSTVFEGATWQFVPRWNQSNIFSSVLTTTGKPG